MNTYANRKVDDLIRKISELEEENKRLRLLEERYQVAIECSSDYIFEYDVINDEILSYGNPFDASVSKKKTIEKKDFVKNYINKGFCAPRDLPKIMSFLQGTSTHIEVQLRIPNAINKYIWFSIQGQALLIDDKVVKIIGRAVNINGRKIKEEETLQASFRDGLTGLYNPTRGLELLEEYIATGNEYALILLDIADLRSINDNYSFTFGNAVIKQIADILDDHLDEYTQGIRIGGDEFLILKKETSKEEAIEFCKDLKEELKTVYTGEKNSELVTSYTIVHNAKWNGYPLFDKVLGYMSERMKSFEVGCIKVIDNAELSEFASRRLRQSGRTTFAGISNMYADSMPDLIPFAFDLLEKTKNTDSAINMLFACIGRAYDLKYIKLYEIDNNYLTKYMTHSWFDDAEDGEAQAVQQYPSANVLNELLSTLDDDGMKEINYDTYYKYSRETQDYLNEYLAQDVLFSQMFISGEIKGLIVFASKTFQRGWTQDMRYTLLELSKLVSTHISKHKADSANRAKSEFLSRMSHEIRTPINGITGMLAIMKSILEDESDGEPKKELQNIHTYRSAEELRERKIYEAASLREKKILECLTKVSKSTEFLLSIINDILEMSKIESGKLKIVNNEFKMSALLDDIDIMFSQQMCERELQFGIISNYKNNYLIGDSLRISQVIINLISNALKFTEPGGRVTLTVEQTATEDNVANFSISVKDTGIGISEDDMKRIFNLFEQASERKRTITGTGLGLSISSNIVRLLGGTLEVKSTVGEGSDFYFDLLLPIAENRKVNEAGTEGEIGSDDSLQASIKQEKQEPDFSGKRLLLVEDNELNAEIAQTLFEMKGFTVEKAEDGQIAVDTFLTHDSGYYDIIIMDIRMPNMDGVTATEIIRTSDKSDARSIPIIAMTSDAFDEDIERSIKCGMNGHLTKPVEVDKMYEILAQVLAGK